MTLSVIVATSGRTSLAATLDSIAEQLEPGDELLIRCSDDDDFGNRTRQSLMEEARGSHLVFMDDDDQFARGAFAAMRRVAAKNPGRVAIFRMRYLDGSVIWRDPVLRGRNVSTQMFLVPNVRGKLGRWENSDYTRMADWSFISQTAELQGEPLFCDEIVAHFRSDRRALPRLAKRVAAPFAEARYRLAPRTRVRRALGRI